jgi:methionyl-tRNA synthetase
VTEQEPWKIAKDEANKERLATVLYCVAETLRAIAVLYNPIMPESSKKIWNILGANESIGDINKQNIDKVGTWGMLPAGSKVIKGEAIFPRLAEDEQ